MEVGCHHAEMNAIANAAARGTATDGAWMFTSVEPCVMCAKMMHHAGIARVLCIESSYKGGSSGSNYLRGHGIEVVSL
jgi:dCMP deaminase